MKNDSGVSSFVGVVLLLLLVIVVSSILALTLSTATQNAVESTPNVVFALSEDPQMLYHGGGDVLYKDRLKFYDNGVDITHNINIDSTNTWTEWRTGQAIELPADYYVANLTIIAIDTLGRDQLLYRGSGVVVTPLPTPTVTPTTTPTVTPTPTPTTPTPTVTPTPTPIPTPNPYYTVGSDHADGFATVEEFVESLNNWSNALYGADVAILYGGNNIAFFGDIPIGREPIRITGEMVSGLSGNKLVLNTYGGSLLEVEFTRAPGYEGELLVISSAAELETTGATLKLDGMGHGAAPLLSITSGGSLDVYQDLTLINSTNPTGNGGALYNAGNLKVSTNLIIYNNTANNGGGIYNLGEITLYSDSDIRDNVALEKGGGIYNAGLSGVSIKGPITNNSARYGGGVYNDGTMTSTGSISGNTASISGGGVYNAGTYTFSWTSLVTGNQAQYGGGIYNEGTIPFFGGTISDNIATIDGGGIYNTDTIALGSTPISDNEALQNGGGIYNSGSITSITGRITGNAAGGDGGGIYNIGTMSPSWFVLSNNEAVGNGGGLYNLGSLPALSGTISDNIATIDGGGIYNTGDITSNSWLPISNNEAIRNGGGLYNAGSYTMTSGSFTGNIAGNIGNKIYATGDSTNSISDWIVTLKKHGSYYYAD